jgi:hypothetical protein
MQNYQENKNTGQDHSISKIFIAIQDNATSILNKSSGLSHKSMFWMIFRCMFSVNMLTFYNFGLLFLKIF